MMLSLKPFTVRRFSGFILLIYKDSALIPESWSEEVFAAFDESLLKLQTDFDATRIPPPISGNFPLEVTYLYTCLETIQRLFQAKNRQLFVPHATLSCLETKTHVSNAPSWVHQCFEGPDGSLFEFPASKNLFSFTTSRYFHFLHLSFFSKNMRPHLCSTTRQESHCLAHLIQRADLFPLNLSLSLESKSGYNFSV